MWNNYKCPNILSDVIDQLDKWMFTALKAEDINDWNMNIQPQYCNQPWREKNNNNNNNKNGKKKKKQKKREFSWNKMFDNDNNLKHL